MDVYFFENKTYLIDGRGYSVTIDGVVIPPYTSGKVTTTSSGVFPTEIQTLIDDGYLFAKRMLTQDDSIGGGTGAVIDDNVVAPDKAWSSQKINQEISITAGGAGTVFLTTSVDTFVNDIVYVDGTGITQKPLADGSLPRHLLESIYICKDSFIFGGQNGNFYRPGNTITLTGAKGSRLYLSNSVPGGYTTVAPTSGDIVLLGFFRDTNSFEWNPQYLLSIT